MISRFEHDDAAYVAWLRQHPDGYVINTRGRPDPAYVILHRAQCPTISRVDVVPGAWTGRGYRKIGCPSLDDVRVAVMAEGRGNGEPSRRCSICCK